MLFPKMTESRTVISLDGFWSFKVDFEAEGIQNQWQHGIPDSRVIAVPASYNDLFTEQRIRDFVGDVWYQKDFVIGHIPDRAVLRFGSATHRATVWLNGQEIGSHEGGFLPFEFDVTHLLALTANRLVVKINNTLSFHSLPVGTVDVIGGNSRFHHPAFDFFNYSGIHRSVVLYTTPIEHIQDITLIPAIDGTTGILDYTIAISHPGIITQVDVLDHGQIVATSSGPSGQIKIPSCTFWHPDHPYLYTLRMTYGKDIYMLETGIRTVRVDGNKLLINDAPIYLKGFGKHDDFTLSGKGLNLPVMIRDFELLKWIGANSVRTTHYPYPEEFYMLADQYGILVIDEVPAVGMWKRSIDLQAMGNKPFFSEDGIMTKTMTNHKHQLHEMVIRDKNHPSVIIWSLANEPATDETASYAYFKEIFAYARTLDPQNRPLGFVNCAIALPHQCLVSPLGDLLMLNRYQGWYSLAGAQFHLAKATLHKELTQWTALYDKPIIMTEYGADAIIGLHQLPSVMFSEEYQTEFLESYHEVFDRFENIIGEHPWNFADFNTEQELKRVGGNKKGIFTRERQPKMVAHMLRRRWLDMPNKTNGQ